MYLTITNYPYGVRVHADRPGTTWEDLDDITQHALIHYTYLIPFHATVSATGLADLIDAYYINPRTQSIAAHLRQLEESYAPHDVSESTD